MGGAGFDLVLREGVGTARSGANAALAVVDDEDGLAARFDFVGVLGGGEVFGSEVAGTEAEVVLLNRMARPRLASLVRESQRVSSWLPCS